MVLKLVSFWKPILRPSINVNQKFKELFTYRLWKITSRSILSMMQAKWLSYMFLQQMHFQGLMFQTNKWIMISHKINLVETNWFKGHSPLETIGEDWGILKSNRTKKKFIPLKFFHAYPQTSKFWVNWCVSDTVLQ